MHLSNFIDKIKTRKEIKIYDEKNDKDYFILLGGMIGGFYKHSEDYDFCLKGEEYIKIFDRILQKTENHKFDYCSEFPVKDDEVRYVVNNMTGYLIDYKCFFWNDTERQIPGEILLASKEMKKYFLQSLFSLRASISYQHKEYNTYRISINCIYSKRFANDIRLLLTEFGIEHAKITCKTDCNNIKYMLYISGDDVKTFMNEIGFLEEINKKHLDDIKKL
jgi:hypothetical protein